MKISVRSISPSLPPGVERRACSSIGPVGFHLRPPPAPHQLSDFITPESQLFETIHMGSANIDPAKWRLQLDGLLQRPFSLDIDQIRSLPAKTVTAVHECWGSPLRKGTENLLRVGNVTWTGVSLKSLLDFAAPMDGARFVWSEGLDSGEFGGKQMDCYRKDLPLTKALSEDTLLAYELNGEPLRKERGGPVRLVVPGWFGTNMTKWLCRITVQPERAPGPFTNEWYNETEESEGRVVNRPVWDMTPNSMIVAPAAGSNVCQHILLQGWAWASAPISYVDVSADLGKTWARIPVAQRQQYEWQAFEMTFNAHDIPMGTLNLMVRATDIRGNTQPIGPGRNRCHSIEVQLGKI